jgi:hypothetical protein
MTGSSRDVSSALCAYLGAGKFSYPSPLASRIREVFGEPAATELEKRVMELVDESFAIAIDWNEHSLASAGEHVRATMRARHPDLSPEAIEALVWNFTYNWR